LTGANVYVKNELFATLDPTAKKFTIDNVEFILIDTVGFLQELPHNLIEAFKSTLESALHADLALIVCDGTGEYEMQFNTTIQTLSELGFSSPYLHVMNKCEDMKDFSKLPTGCIPISAKENMGIEDLKREIWKKFNDEFCICELLVPYEEMKSYSKLKKYLAEQSISYNDDCAEIKAAIPYSFIDRFQSYIKK
jgi:GTP-binding protein HflX